MTQSTQLRAGSASQGERGVVEVRNLSKSFGAVHAVDDLSFRVEPGRVTGFLGPNGAGKTTTLRMLLGLVAPTSGTATIGGLPYRGIAQPTRVIGAALEAASFHPGRTARDHLRMYAPQVGVPDARCDEVLDLVGLGEAARRRVGEFSLGMRQRLGLAVTLLGDPPVLVLDEPANGLDPEGIAWLRGLLRHLAREGRTVLVSSHVLSEVQQTVDEVVIIARGRLVHASALAALAALTRSQVRVASPDVAGLRRLVAEHWPAADVPDRGSTREDLVVLQDVTAADVGRAAFHAGLELHELSTDVVDLEEAFLRLTADPGPEAPAGGAQATGGDPR